MKRPGYERKVRFRMDHRMSRIDKAKAERERLCAEAAEHRTQANQHLISASELEAKAQELEIFVRWWEQLGDDERLDEGEADQAGTDLVDTVAKLHGESNQSSQFYGMGQPGAVTLLLKTEGRNMTTAEVTQELRQRGFEFATKDPVRAVDWALKRAAEAGHVIKVDRSLWKASPNADPAALETNSRSARTIAGLKVAQRRGVRLGTPPKITEEHRCLAVSLFDQGETVSEIARRCGVSTVALSRHIQEWRGEGRFPPARPKGRKKKTEPEDQDRETVH